MERDQLAEPQWIGPRCNGQREGSAQTTLGAVWAGWEALRPRVPMGHRMAAPPGIP